MPRSIRPVRVNHMNVVVEDFDASVAHLRELYGAEFMADMPQKEWHACLMNLGGVLFELFAPHVFLLNARYGPHYLGLEYQADLEEVREAIAQRGIRIARDIGLAVHTHPADTLGVAFEFYDGSFHEREWPALGGGRIRPAAFWRDEHPLGLTGLQGCTLAVDDLEAASAFLEGFLSAEKVSEADRPRIAARARGLRVADGVVELLAPTGEGPIAQHLRRYGPGVRSTVFGVRDLAQARRWFEGRGLPPEAGDAPDSFAAPFAADLGVIFEFRA
jgi:catechol 2,3-dioxygenase-like lactoylglutathione lyase family enzyme